MIRSMAKITKVSNSRFPRKSPRGGGRPSPSPGRGRADRRISNTKSFLSSENQNKPTSPGSK